MINNIIKTANVFYKLATIPTPIRDMKHFVNNFSDNLINKLNQLKSHLESPSILSDEEEIKYYFNDVFGRRWMNNDIQRFIEECNSIADKFKNDSMFDYIKSAEGPEFREALRYLFNRLGYTLEDLERLNNHIHRDIVDTFEYADSHIEDYKNPQESPGYYEYYLKLKKVPELSQSILDYYKHYYNGLKETIRMRTAPIISGRDDNPPETEDEEILYHATINADKIYNEGFIKEDVKTEGIGGSTETKSGKKGISFTSDLYIAKEVARCLKEVIMIANGEISANDILEWSNDKDKILKSVKSTYGKLNLEDPNDIFKIYNNYLWLDKRYNPLFFGISDIVSMFGGKNPNQVGIIAAKVNMKNPDISYHVGMLEYRVPSEAIIKIEKLIK